MAHVLTPTAREENVSGSSGRVDATFIDILFDPNVPLWPQSTAARNGLTDS